MTPTEQLREIVVWLRPTHEDPEARAAFDAWCRERRPQEARRLAGVILGCTLAWWPTDAVILRGIPDAWGPFVMWRALVGLTMLAYLVAGPRLRSERAQFVAFALATSFGPGVMGYTQMSIGGPDRPWLHFCDLLMFSTTVISFAPWSRVLATGCTALAVIVGAALSPRPFGAPSYTLLWLSFLACNVGLSLLFGHTLYTLNRRNHAQSLDLARANRHLERRVAEKTADLGALLSQVESAREQERTRIARDLHDELGQELAALRYSLRLARRHHARAPEAIGGNFDELAALLDRTQGTMRQILHDLRPRVLDDLGLVAALEWLVSRASARAEAEVEMGAVEGDGDLDALPAEVSLCLFRAAQEALGNAVTHGAAAHIAVSLRVEPRLVYLVVRDDGRGFDPEAPRRGHGLLGMRERVEALRGRLRVRAAPGEGAEVEVTLPLRASLA